MVRLLYFLEKAGAPPIVEAFSLHQTLSEHDKTHYSSYFSW